jgi:DNA-binding NtrC family response regulator
MSARVLIVDDQPIVAATLMMILKRFGYEVTAFHLGEHALEHAKAAPPDLALIDALLTVSDGVSVAMELTAIAPSCKVFVMSGGNEVLELLNAAATKGFHFELLPKPIAPPELLEKVRAKLAS